MLKVALGVHMMVWSLMCGTGRNESRYCQHLFLFWVMICLKAVFYAVSYCLLMSINSSIYKSKFALNNYFYVSRLSTPLHYAAAYYKRCASLLTLPKKIIHITFVGSTKTSSVVIEDKFYVLRQFDCWWDKWV